MHGGKGSMHAAELRERMERLDDAGPLRPAAAHACGVGDHRGLAAPQCGLAGPKQLRSQARLLELAAAPEDLRRPHVLDHRRRGQAVHREADAARPQVRANLLVLGAVESVLVEPVIQAPVRAFGPFVGGQQRVQEHRKRRRKRRVAPGRARELLEVRALAR